MSIEKALDKIAESLERLVELAEITVAEGVNDPAIVQGAGAPESSEPDAKPPTAAEKKAAKKATADAAAASKAKQLAQTEKAAAKKKAKAAEKKAAAAAAKANGADPDADEPSGDGDDGDDALGEGGEDEGITIVDVRRKLVKIAKTDRTGALGVLAKFGCKNITQLKKKDWEKADTLAAKILAAQE